MLLRANNFQKLGAARLLGYRDRMARPLPARADILNAFEGGPRGVHLAELCTRLSLPAGSRKRLRTALDQLVDQGILSALPGQRYRRPETAPEHAFEGALSVHPRGFGFVSAPGETNVYVPPQALAGALHGDRVQVEVVSSSPRGLEGRVASVVERRSELVVGNLRRRGRSLWLEPDDGRIRGPIVLNGRPAAASDGKAAVVRVTRFPASVQENPEGELVEVLGTPGEARVEVAKILAREEIEEAHKPETLAEAEARMAELAPPSLKTSSHRRRDLRDIPLLTIDPDDARDHDDAVYVEKRPEGFRVYVAIADVSEYVLPGGALEAAAHDRCFTTYLPDRAVPMLPGVLAADQCSLLPGEDRFALCVILDLNADATVKRFRIVEALVRVVALITYRQAACVLGFIEEAPDPAARTFKRELRAVHQVARKLRSARLKRGALDLNVPEPKVELDPDTGEPVTVSRRAQVPGMAQAYQMVEEMMLLANERVARWLVQKKSHAVFRVHGAPDPERLETLANISEKVGISVDAESLSDPESLARWLKRAAKHPLSAVLSGLLLRSLKMAQYSTTNLGHFGLASEKYVHFTSPIRRYPDLLVHRLVKGLLRHEPAVKRPAEVEALAESAVRASQVERRVLQAEREVVDVYRCLLMRDRVGEVFEGRVSSFVGSGVYVTLDDPFVDVLVRFESLGLDRYELSDDHLAVFGSRSGERIALGDPLVVELEEVSLWRRSLLGRRLVSPRGQSASALADRAESHPSLGPPDRAAAERARGAARGMVTAKPKRRVGRANRGTAPDKEGRGRPRRGAGPRRGQR